MRAKFLLVLPAVSILLVLAANNVGVSYCSFTDGEAAVVNTLTAWSSSLWRQTTQADFNAGVLNSVDTSSSPGDVKLAAGAWAYRKQITVDHTKVAGTDQSNFPVLISLTDSALRYSGNGGHVAQSNGGDILFTAADGTTKLSHEIEKYTPSTGELVAWVKIPTLSVSANTIIYVYYGNAGCAAQWNISGTWDSSYGGVWHLKQDPSGTAPQMKDSTANARDGTTVGSMPSGASVACKIGNGLQFDGSNDGVNTSSFAIGATFTMEGWAKFSSLPTAWQTIVQGGASANRDLTVYKNGGGTTSVDFYDGTDNYFNTTISTGSWYQVAATFNGTTLTIYVNGSSIGTLSKSYSSSSGSASMGYSIGLANDYLNGYLDEVRISSVARSSGWIQTEYNNQNSPATFFLPIGAETACFSSSGTIASQVTNTGITGARWDALFWDKTLPASTSITFEVRASASSFAPGDTIISWTAVGGTSPVSSGLPSGRYMQWRATLSTSDISSTPTLSEVRVYYH